MSDKSIIVLIFLVYFSPVFYHSYLLLKEKKDENRLKLKRLLKSLKIGVLVLLCSVLVVAILSHTNYLNYEKPIVYDDYDKITFENFRGLEFFKKSLYGNERFAYVVTTIDTDISEEHVTVKSLFHPSKSFVYNNKINSEELLSHEKYHFKITELFARKAKERIAKINNFSKEKVEAVISNIINEENEYQKMYDYDTFHSYVYNEQKRYEKEVDSLLNLLKDYKKPKIKINVKN